MTGEGPERFCSFNKDPLRALDVTTLLYHGASPAGAAVPVHPCLATYPGGPSEVSASLLGGTPVVPEHLIREAPNLESDGLCPACGCCTGRCPDAAPRTTCSRLVLPVTQSCPFVIANPVVTDGRKPQPQANGSIAKSDGQRPANHRRPFDFQILRGRGGDSI